MFAAECREINGTFSQKMLGSFKNLLNLVSSFYNSEGCIYLHMLVKYYFRSPETLFLCLSSCSFMRNCLSLLEH